jgi:glycine cleavage system H protein
MSKSYAVLPCNGLDKCAGCLSREIALNIAENSDSEIICPVLYRVAEARYNKVAESKPLLVIDGCNTRCASKLAAEKSLNVAQKINVTEEAKSRGVAITGSLRPNDDELRFANTVADDLLKQSDEAEKEDQKVVFPESLNYEIYKKDKFIFRLPTGDFYFNENDCWAYVSGKYARIGVTDFVQQSLSDIMFFTPPTVGSEVEQFGELGTVESGKAVFEVVSPVSGKIISVNEELASAPELINQNPYEKGWIADIELSDFESDRELLLDFDGYFKVLKRKVDEFHVR